MSDGPGTLIHDSVHDDVPVDYDGDGVVDGYLHQDDDGGAYAVIDTDGDGRADTKVTVTPV
jgi:hypothetical protein